MLPFKKQLLKKYLRRIKYINTDVIGDEMDSNIVAINNHAAIFWTQSLKQLLYWKKLSIFNPLESFATIKP